MFISGNDTQADTFLSKNKWLKQRLIDLWNKLLTRKDNLHILKELGSWMNNEKHIFEPEEFSAKVKQTLNLTNGEVEWSYALMNSIEEISKECPLDAIEILKLYFLNTIKEGVKMGPIYVDKEWYNAFKILYSNSSADIKKKTYDTISELIEKGGRPFWSLEEIVK